MTTAKSRPFSASEDRVLLQAIENVGSRNGFRDWFMVHKEAKIPDYDKDQLKQRYSNLRKRGILTLMDYEDLHKLKKSGRSVSRDYTSP